MPIKKHIPAILFIALVLVLLTLFISSVKNAKASLTSCTINSVNPQSITSGSSTTITFNITNSDDGGNLVHSIKITRPSNDFTITSGDGPNAGGTTIGGNGESAAIKTTLSPGETGDFTIGINTNGGVTYSGSFIVEASESSDGDSPVTCSGDTSVSLVSGGSGSINISGVSLSVSSTTSIISWTTAISTTGTVQYGLNSGYGSGIDDTTSRTSHSVTLSGLSPSTTYHYKITATDLSNNTTETSDNTFVTGTVGTSTTVTTTVTNTVTTTVAKLLTDTTPPTVRFKTEFKTIYEEAPLVEVVANDTTGVSRIEYSVDGGVNLNPIDLGERLGQKQISLLFTPNIIEDGDYTLIVKVTDTTGNKTSSKEVNFIIDRLPPRVGPLAVMAGPLIINSDSSDVTDLIIGAEYKFIVSSAGGPNKINLSCDSYKFDFVKNTDIGVWTALVKFDKETLCVPKIIATDGAGNIQETNREQFKVNKLGQFKNGTITIYWYDDFEKKFVIWDASPYGQINPINTGNSDGYGVMLPKGRYYVEGRSIGSRASVSNIIDADETIYINDDWELSPSWKFWQLPQEKILTPKVLGAGNWKDVNFELPKVLLNNLSGGFMSTLDIRGKISIVSLLSSWHPTTNGYLKSLDEVYKKKISVYPILIQEKETASKYLKRRGGYEVDIFADPDGELLNGLILGGRPTTWIVNRFGQVVKTKVGEINTEEIMSEISKIN